MAFCDIQEAISKLWATQVLNCRYDIRSHSLSFDLEMYNEGRPRIIILMFEEVTTLFHNYSGRDRKYIFDDNEPWSKSELFSFYYFSNNPKMVFVTDLNGAKEPWMLNEYGVPNILMEIESTSLFIEAGNMTIDGVRYTLERNTSI